jgi:ankyrin repeat protein
MEISPVWMAVMSNDLKLLNEVLTKDNVNTLSELESYTPLMVAANRSFVEVALLLIANGADLSAKSESGMTALMLAMNPNSEKDSLAISTAILENGGDVNARSDGGNTALMEAGHKGLTKVVEHLLEKGASVDLQNKYGETALMVSCLEGAEPAVVRALLDAGADKDLTDIDGFTAFDLAKKNGNEEVMNMLY